MDEVCLISGEAARGGAWRIDLRWLGCGCGRRLVTDSCCVLSARRPGWVVRGLGRAFLYLSISLYLGVAGGIQRLDRDRPRLFAISPWFGDQAQL